MKRRNVISIDININVCHSWDLTLWRSGTFRYRSISRKIFIRHIYTWKRLPDPELQQGRRVTQPVSKLFLSSLKRLRVSHYKLYIVMRHKRFDISWFNWKITAEDIHSFFRSRFPPYTDTKLTLLRQLLRKRRLPFTKYLPSLFIYGLGMLTIVAIQAALKVRKPSLITSHIMHATWFCLRWIY